MSFTDLTLSLIWVVYKVAPAIAVYHLLFVPNDRRAFLSSMGRISGDSSTMLSTIDIPQKQKNQGTEMGGGGQSGKFYPTHSGFLVDLIGYQGVIIMTIIHGVLP